MIHYSNVNLRMKTALNRWYSIQKNSDVRTLTWIVFVVISVCSGDSLELVDDAGLRHGPVKLNKRIDQSLKQNDEKLRQ
jgi:hypothetical protein